MDYWSKFEACLVLPTNKMVQALLFDPVTRSIESVAFERPGVQLATFDIVCVACIDGVFPGDYVAAAKVLGVENPLHVECWTAKRSGSNTYKVWVANSYEYPPGGIRFFGLAAPFRGKCLLVRYEKIPKNRLEMTDIVKRVAEEGMFYEIPKIRDCTVGDVDYEWIDADKMPDKDKHGYTIVDDDMNLMMTEHMYTCAACAEACSFNKCGRCKKVHYCNAECQKAHWKEHKPVCKA